MQLLVGGVVGDELSELLSSLQALSMSAKEVINKSESFRIGFSKRFKCELLIKRKSDRQVMFLCRFDEGIKKRIQRCVF
ncbi:hypothetical protein OTEC02_18565 [Acinetobacter lactucae]|nr:hypothetical protein OTEC02_18565 [Acinetobacter lactucae]